MPLGPSIQEKFSAARKKIPDANPLPFTE